MTDTFPATVWRNGTSRAERLPGKWLVLCTVLCFLSTQMACAQPQVRPALPDMRIERDIKYAEIGESTLLFDLYLPLASPEPVPLILWIHGGGWQGGSKDNPLPVRLGFPARGYAVAAITYHLTDSGPFPLQIEDCRAAVRYLRANAATYNLDPERFAAWGSSAGGHLAALLGLAAGYSDWDRGQNLDQSAAVQAVVNYFGPSDLIAFAETQGYQRAGRANSPESRLVGGPVLENQEKAKAASPITYVHPEAPPFFIAHGDMDRVVPPDQSIRLAQALMKAGVDVELHIIPGAEHGGPPFHSEPLVSAVADFLKRSFNGSQAQAAAASHLQVDGHRWRWESPQGTVTGIMVKPEGEGPFPAIIVSHGMGADAEHFALPWAKELAALGLVCIAPDYTHKRGADATDREHFGASAENVRRAVACLDILSAQPEVDLSRVAAYGNSMGAFVTIALAAEASSQLSAAIITAGGIVPHPGFPAPDSSRAEHIRTPFLILHGTADTVVRPETSARLYALLQQNGVKTRREVFEGALHDLHISHRNEIVELMQHWLTDNGVLYR